jgi:hypothetical protein
MTALLALRLCGICVVCERMRVAICAADLEIDLPAS